MKSVLLLALAWLSRFPTFKRTVVGILSRIPALDGKLRSALTQAQHPDAILDVDHRQLSEPSSEVLARLKAGVRR